jgi:signal transduction histidine kinase
MRKNVTDGLRNAYYSIGVNGVPPKCDTQMENKFREKRSPVRLKIDNDWVQRQSSSGEVRGNTSRDNRLRVLVYRPDEQNSLSRDRAAQDLHDHVGQFVAGLFLRLNILCRHVTSQAGRSQIELMRAQLSRLEDELAHLYEPSRPAALSSGLPAAISALLRDWENTAGFHVDFQCNQPELWLDPDVEIALYRVAQEAITNIVKHAPSTTNVEVTLKCSENDWELLAVSDDGAGFNAKVHLTQSIAKRKLGLAGMRRRLSDIGGDLEIVSFPGLGTTIVARRNPAAVDLQPKLL